MVEIVEAINSVHSALKSDATNPLDIKPSNILVDTNEQGEFRGLYLTDFGHIAEMTPRKATIEYAPPLPASGKGIGNESPVTYDIWSTACILLQVLVFIDGDCKATELDLFNSERQRDFPDASFWTDKYGESTLKESTLRLETPWKAVCNSSNGQKIPDGQRAKII
ncbi:hypothetical protein LX36DRAFT_716483 [Colletotrichum falcatum]|nr:hypothetical protein LX36DRAFT_716483 [Colletotrichum falcatum]